MPEREGQAFRTYGGLGGFVRMNSHLQGLGVAEGCCHVCGIDNQLAVIDHLVAGRMQGDRPGFDLLHLIRHHPQLPAVTGQVV